MPRLRLREQKAKERGLRCSNTNVQSGKPVKRKAAQGIRELVAVRLPVPDSRGHPQVVGAQHAAWVVLPVAKRQGPHGQSLPVLQHSLDSPVLGERPTPQAFFQRPGDCRRFWRCTPEIKSQRRRSSLQLALRRSQKPTEMLARQATQTKCTQLGKEDRQPGSSPLQRNLRDTLKVRILPSEATLHVNTT